MLSLLLYGSESLTSPIPHGTSSHGSKPSQKGHLSPTAPARHTHIPTRDCWPMGQGTMAAARLLPWALMGRQG